MVGMGGELRATMSAVAAVFRNRNLRLMEAARASALLATSGSTVVFVIVAYRLGGPGAVAALAVVRLVVAAIGAPIGAALGDRYDRQKVIVAADALRILNLAGAAVASAWTSSLPIELGLAALTTAIGLVSAPARAALLPTLAPTPEALTAANVVAGATDAVSSFAGPALAGAALALVSPASAFAATAAVAMFSPVPIAMMRVSEDARESGAHEPLFARATLAGFGALLGSRSARGLVMLYAVIAFVGGALTVLFAVTAIRLLGLGSSGVGFVYSFFSGGAIAGSVVAVLIIRRSLENAVVAGAIAWGLPLAAVGLWPKAGLAYALFFIGGAGDAVAGVAAETLLQRVIPQHVLSRSFGALSSMLTGIGVLGSLAAPLVVTVAGVRGALIIFGAIVPIGALPAGARLRASARAAPPALAVFRAVEILMRLPDPALERLAAAAEEVHVPPNGIIFRAGDDGDRFYVVRGGEVEISSNRRIVSVETEGGSFGEISLLRNIPRTATAIAPLGSELYAIARDHFVDAITTHPAALEAVEATISRRLAGIA